MWPPPQIFINNVIRPPTLQLARGISGHALVWVALPTDVPPPQIFINNVIRPPTLQLARGISGHALVWVALPTDVPPSSDIYKQCNTTTYSPACSWNLWTCTCVGGVTYRCAPSSDIYEATPSPPPPQIFINNVIRPPTLQLARAFPGHAFFVERHNQEWYLHTLLQ